MEVNNTDRAILASVNETAKAGAGTITQEGTLIAYCDKSFSSTTDNDWQTIEVPLIYIDQNVGTGEELNPESMNVIISSADYWIRDNIGAENQLDIDNIQFVYWHALKTLSYDGAEISFDENTLNYDLSSTVYDASKLHYTIKGKAATAHTNYNRITGKLTIRVEGEDIAADANSFTEYTIQFKAPTGEISNIKYNGVTLEGFSQGTKHYYSIAGTYSEGCLTATAADNGFDAGVNYDNESHIATINVPEVGNDVAYYVQFVKDGVNYDSKLLISMAGSFLAAPSQNVIIAAGDNPNTIDLQLLNFSLDGGESIIGDIFVPNVTLAADGSFTKTMDNFAIFGDNAIDINSGITELTLNGVLGTELNATINITWSEYPIIVSVTPINSNTIDATNIEEVDVTAIKEGLTNPNCIVYVNEDVSTAETNVICGNTCASLAIKDGVAFSAPKDFTATSVTYDRTLTAGEVSTFVLPFAFTPDANTTVAELASVNGTSLVFKPISTSETVANKPYVVKSTNADALKTFSNVNVKATTGATLTTEVYGYKHIGSYETLTGLTGYGYAGGEFVYTTRGTLNPYRTYITAPAGSEAEAFSLVIDNSTTGLDSVSNAAEGANDCYDLSGRRVARPSKGLYILNGKKVIMK